MKSLVQTILNATAAGKSMLLAANAAAQKVLLSLQNVDNTSDANKPVSTAQQTAIDLKIGGSVGTTTNRLVKSSGTGGLTLQSTGITIDSSNNLSGVGAVSTNDNITAGNSVQMSWGGGGAIFKALGGGTLSLRANDALVSHLLIDTSGNAAFVGLVCAGTYTVGTLPSAAANAYKFATVSDSSVTTFGSTVAAGGSSKVMVFSNGTNWTVFAI